MVTYDLVSGGTGITPAGPGLPNLANPVVWDSGGTGRYQMIPHLFVSGDIINHSDELVILVGPDPAIFTGVTINIDGTGGTPIFDVGNKDIEFATTSNMTIIGNATYKQASAKTLTLNNTANLKFLEATIVIGGSPTVGITVENNVSDLAFLYTTNNTPSTPNTGNYPFDFTSSANQYLSGYQNTIEITDLSWNTIDTSNNFWTAALFNNDFNSYTDISTGEVITDLTNNTGVVTYRAINETGINSLWIKDTSGQLQSGGITTLLPDYFGGSLQILQTSINRVYYGMSYILWDASFNYTTSDLSGNFIFHPEDDSEIPELGISSPGFVAMAEPITIKSSLDEALVGEARVRISGTTSSTGIGNHENETISDSSGTSAFTYYVTNLDDHGIIIGIDSEPNPTDQDYIFFFFANDACYHQNTNIQTLNGIKQIQDIKRGDLVKTKNGFKKVVRMLRSGLSNGRKFIVFKKNSLGENIPNKDLMITKGHPVYYRGKYINSCEFINNGLFKNIYIEHRTDTDGLYHLQFESHELIDTHNMWTTSLPHNCGTYVKKEDYFDQCLYNENAKNKHYPPYCLHPDPPKDKLDDDDLEHIYMFNESDDEESED